MTNIYTHLLNNDAGKIAAGLIAAALLMPLTAHAATDWKTYPGTICQPGNNVRQIDYDAFGGACNKSSTKHVVVHCPVVREFGVSRFPTHIKLVGRSGDPDTPLRCVFRAMKTGAVDSGYQMERTSVPIAEIVSGQATTIRSVESSFTTGRPRGIEDFGALVLTCDLPATRYRKNGTLVQSCLYNYSVREWSD